MIDQFPNSPFNWVDRLPHLERNALLAAYRPLTARQGGDAFRDGDLPPGIFRVISGSAEMRVEAPDGRRFLLNCYQPGESFGEIPALDGGPHIATVSLRTGTILSFLSTSDTHRLRAAYPQINEALMHASCQTLRSLYRAYVARLSLNVEQLIKERLDFLARRMPGESAPEHYIEITQADLASMLGLSRRRVLDALSTLEDQGELVRSYGGVRLLEKGSH